MRASTGAELAIVTGASSGIGAALARQLSRRGRPVLAVARREERLVALTEEARARGQASIHPLALDLAASGAAELVRDRARELGGAAWLVNNAGYGLYGPFDALPGERLAGMVRLNCEALVALTHAILPDLFAAGRGRIVNVASLAAFLPSPFISVYGATKAFVLSFSEGLAEELRGTGVSVTAFCPGPVETEFGEVAGYSGRPRDPPGKISAEEAARALIAAAEMGAVATVPGTLNKLTAALVRLLPRAVVRRASGAVLAPPRRRPLPG
jgi:short-subunit dehydrogenase